MSNKSMYDKFTIEQKNAVDARGQILVSAAAGSGKTAVLVERVARRILDETDKIDADRLLIVTFTNAAAAEMRNRISMRIDEEMKKSPDNQWYRHQKFLLNKANICTIDSFCIALVREFFYNTDFEPDFTTGDKTSLDRISESALSATLNEFFKSEESQILGNVFNRANLVTLLPDIIKKMCSYLETLPYYEKYINSCIDMYDEFDIHKSIWTNTVLAPFKKYAHQLLSDLCELENELISCNDYEVYAEYYNNMKEKTEILVNALPNNEWHEIYHAICDYDNSAFTKKGSRTDFRKALNSAYRNCRDMFSELSAIVYADEDVVAEDILKTRPAIHTIFELVKKYTKQMDILKKRQGVFGFGDIEQAALKLLVDENGERTDVANELSKRYFEVMVDEYQDTNELQNSIFTAISDSGKHLFAVGDVKQSIYRFRKANPAIFLEKKSTLPEYDSSNKGEQKCKVIMSGNFRSDKSVCEFVNFLFSHLMSKSAGQMEYLDEDMLNAHKIFNDNAPQVSVNFVDTIRQITDTNDAEMQSIAEYISSMVGKTEVGDEDNRHKANYRDVTVLCRKGKSVLELCSYLNSHGIPAISIKRDGFLSAREITVAISLLCTIVNHSNDIELLTLMMSEIFSFTSAQMAQIRVDSRYNRLYTSVLDYIKHGDDETLKGKLSDFVKKLDTYRKLAVQMPLYELINRLYDETGLMNLVRVSGGEKACANLRLLAGYADDYDNASVSGLEGFVRYITRQRDNGSNIDGATASVGADMVNVMTMHNSKGLQFPICICAFLHDKFNDSDFSDIIIRSDNCGIGMQIVDNEKHIQYKSLPFRATVIEEQSAMVAEEMRLLYVALTRAQEYLMVSAEYKQAKNSAKSALTSKINKLAEGIVSFGTTVGILPEEILSCKSASDMLLLCMLIHPNSDILRNRCETEIPHEKSAVKGLSVNIIDAAELEPREIVQSTHEYSIDESMLDNLSHRLSYSYPYEKINAIAAKQSASRIAHESEHNDYSCSAIPLFLQGEKLTAAQKGTAMHKFMQYIDIVAAKKSVDSELERVKKQHLLSEIEAQSIKKAAVEKYVASPLAQRMLDAQSVYHEREFMVEIDAHELNSEYTDADEEKIVVQGAVDCLFFENDGIVIVDYKTDRVQSGDELKEKYAPQLKVYAKAVNQIYNMPIKQLLLYSFELGEEIIV